MRHPGHGLLRLTEFAAGLAVEGLKRCARPPGYLPVVLAVLLGLAFSGASAQSVTLELGYEAEGLVAPEELIGEWRAIVKEQTYPQPVTLRIDRVEPGETAGKMTFASPRRCVVDLEYGGPHEGRHIFYIIRFTNCFEYENTDFVAISATPETGEPKAQAAQKEKWQEGEQPETPPEPEVLKQFELGATAPQVAEMGTEDSGSEDSGAEESSTGTRQARLERIKYVISLGGVEREIAIMTRR